MNRKDDYGKLRYDLMTWDIVKGIVSVLTFGAIKYSENSWQDLENAEERYFAALMRHLIAWREGERTDPESGLPTIDHISTNLAFLKYFEEKSKKYL